VKIEGLYGNRNGIGKPEDKDVTLIIFKNEKDVLAAIVNIACHPTVLGARICRSAVTCWGTSAVVSKKDWECIH